jgi:hypothetical protein
VQAGQQQMAQSGQSGGPEGFSDRRGEGPPPGQSSGSNQAGSGMGQPGMGNGGHGGAQDPLDGTKRDSMAPGRVDPRGQHTSTPYKDLPDWTPQRAAAYTASPEFQRRTEAAMRREEIPAAHREQVKNYFDAIRGR